MIYLHFVSPGDTKRQGGFDKSENAVVLDTIRNIVNCLKWTRTRVSQTPLLVNTLFSFGLLKLYLILLVLILPDVKSARTTQSNTQHALYLHHLNLPLDPS